ncbi:hypothetical protein [Sinomonas sp. ASV486]|uniref:hypothetical protein n=1 Tax=Sinomonas sp. ASV486 TaxID=3051170 RepID=UPI0027DD7786|nr:hypothetical protein [Sinomonas sp. ASV486]
MAEEAARRRERRGIQSANIALYAAALLMVAAAALFLTSSVDKGLRLAGLAGVTALFYVAGLVVHARFPRLRPAAVAFAGTGLALLPVTGLGLDIVVLHRPSLSWLITSLVGLVAFGFAAVRIESRVLVYLSLTFVFTTAWSGTEVLGGALAADYAALIGAAAVLALVSAVEPRWVPPLYLRPIAQLHPYVVPSTFVAATVTVQSLDRWQYPGLVAAMSVYLAATSFLTGRALMRRLSWWGARTTSAIAAGVGAAQAADAGLTWFGHSALAAGAVAAVVMIALGTLASAALEWRAAPGLGLSPRVARVEQATGVFVQAALVAVVSAVSTPGADGYLFIAAAVFGVTAQFVAWRWGAPADWLPVLAFAVLPFLDLARWPLAVLAVEGCLYFASRAVWPPARAVEDSLPVWGRIHFVAAARLASLLAVPSIVAALLPDSTRPSSRVAAVAFAVLATAAAQLAGTGVLGAARLPEYRRGAMTWVLASTAFVSVTTVGVAGGTLFAPASHLSPLYGPAVSVACAGAVGLWAGLFLVPSVPVGLDPDGSVTGRPGLVAVGESVPNLLLGVLALEAFLVGEGGLSNAVLALSVSVLGISAWRASSTIRRWAYIWLARGAATLLALGVFRELELDGWRPVAFGERITGVHIFAAVVLVQVAVPIAVELWGHRTGRRFRWTLEDAAVVLGVALPATAAVAMERLRGVGMTDSLSHLAAIIVVAFAVASALAGMALRLRRASAAVAPVALAVMAVVAARDLRVLEILTALFTVFSAAMVYLAPQAASKGAHLVAARALPVALAMLVAQDATASPTWISVVLAVGLALQHVVRRVLAHATAALPFQEATYWSGLAGQLAVPLGYLLFARQGPEGGRWVILLEALFVVVSVLATLRSHPRAGYVGVAGLLLGAVALGPSMHFQAGQILVHPLLSGQSTALLLAAVALAHIAGMARWEPRAQRGGQVLPWAWTAGAGAFAVSAVVLAMPERSWILGVAVGAAAAVLLAASYVWTATEWISVITFPLGVLLTLSAGSSIALDLVDGLPVVWREPVRVMAGTLVPAAAAVALRWSGRWPGRRGQRVGAAGRFAADPVRRWSLSGAAVVALAASGTTAWNAPAAVVLPFLVAALVAVVVPELWPRFRRLGVEVGAVVLTAAVQRAVFAGGHDPSTFWLVQWYVVVAAVIALLRYYVRRSVAVGRAWLEGSSGALTLTGLWTLFEGDNAQQVWLLVAFAVLTLAGLLLSERRFTIWGVAGVVACVLWSVRAYVYALLGILGLAIIAAAVWWLARRPRGTLLR